MVLPTAQLWRTAGTSNFSAGFFLALLAAIGTAFVVKRTSLGYEIRAVGLGPDAARTAGIRVGKTQATAMALSGALAGLAGAVEVLAVHRRYLDAFSPGYGFDSIAVATPAPSMSASDFSGVHCAITRSLNSRFLSSAI